MAKISTDIDSIAKKLDNILDVAFLLDDSEQRDILNAVKDDGEQILRKHTPKRSGDLATAINSEITNRAGSGISLEVGFYGPSKGGTTHYRLAHLVNSGTANRYRYTNRGTKVNTGRTNAQRFIEATQSESASTLSEKMQEEALELFERKWNSI